LITLKVETVTVKTSCVHCGSPIEKEVKMYKGKDFLNEEWLKKNEIYPDDPYTFVHLLCDKCDIMRGFMKGSYKEHQGRRQTR